MYADEKLQKILAIIILLIIPAFIFKEYKSLTMSRNGGMVLNESLIKNEYTKEENKFFVVVVFTHDKSSFSKNNLESIFNQSYSLYRVVYLYNNQESLNYQEAVAFVKEKGLEGRISFIKKENREDDFISFYQMLHQCLDEEIVVHLDERDWLADSDVLNKLNTAYQDPDVWLTYSDYMHYPSLQREGLTATINKNLREFRSDKTPWMLSHLKTYYAGLLKQVTPSPEGLNEKASSKEDKMLMLSLLKIGKWHVKFIPEVLTVHKEDE